MAIYFERTYRSIHKLLYLKDENNPFLEDNIIDLVLELVSGDEILYNNTFFVHLIFNVQALRYRENKAEFRKQALKCMSICDSISKKLKKV